MIARPLSTLRLVIAVVCAATVSPVAAGAEWSSSVRERLESARAAAARDDHALAIAGYRDAIAQEPSVRDSVAYALACQLTWAARYAEAEEEFAWLLARQPAHLDARRTRALARSWSGDTAGALEAYRSILASEPGDVDAALGEARMLAWLGRTTEAVHRYEGLAQAYPENDEARLGLAMVHNWRGDHERAASYYGQVAAESSRADAYEGLAWARQWGGRPSEAIDALRAQEAHGPLTPGGRALRERIEADWNPRASAELDWAEDSDDFVTRGYRTGVDWPLRYRTRLRAGILRTEFRQPDQPDVDELWATGGFLTQLHPRIHARASVEVLVDEPEGSDTPSPAADLSLAVLAHDRLRVDAGASVQQLFTYSGSPHRVSLALASVGVTWRPQYRTTIVVSADGGRYDDVLGPAACPPAGVCTEESIDRSNVRARVRYLLFQRRPRLQVEAGTQMLDCSRDLDDGLWTPDLYRAYFGRVEAEILPDRPVVGLVSIDGGWAKESPRPYDPFLAYSLGVVWHAGGFRVEARGGRSDSNAESARGYRRTFASLGLSAGF